MLRRVIEHHLMGRVMQKRGATFHRLQDATFAFDAQRLRRDRLPLGDPAHQRLGLMDIQVVEHEMPLRRLGIAGNQALEVSQRILFGARWPPGRLNHLSGHHIKIDEPG